MSIVGEAGLPACLYAGYPVAVRRRRVVLALIGTVALSGVVAESSGSSAAWAAFAVASALGVTYIVLLRRSCRMAMEHEFPLLVGATRNVAEHQTFFEGLADLSVTSDSGDPAAVVPLDAMPAWRQALALTWFLALYAAGWALTPVMVLLTIAVGKTARDTTAQRWLVTLQALQLRIKQQSMRTLMVSAAATAGVTGVAVVATSLSGAGPAAAATALASNSYTVRPGDTLASIAARLGVTYQALAATNHIANPNLIYPGQVLIVSGSSPGHTPSSPTATSATYTVRSGDTLASIAARFGTTYQALAAINGISNPNIIYAGQVLRLSGSAPADPPRAPTTTTRSAPAPVSSKAEIAVNTALAQVGKPYQWAGAGPSAFDCSGLVMYAWEAAGVQLAHYTVSQYQETARISEGQLEPGDLVFYDTGSGAQPGHVSLYLGNGRIVTADSPGTVIRVENIGWDGVPIGFGRVQ
jgi:peptidoglycan endopeptidase LytE